MNIPSLRHFSKEMQVFMGASLLNAAGSALVWPLVAMFVFDELGRSMADAGLALLVQSLGGIGGQLAGGALYHRLGVKRLTVGSLALASLGLIALPFAGGSWPAFIALLAWIGWWNAMASPAIQSFIGFRFPERRAEMFNAVYVANNIGVAIGTAASGFLAELSYAISFAGREGGAVLSRRRRRRRFRGTGHRTVRDGPAVRRRRAAAGRLARGAGGGRRRRALPSSR